MRRGNLLRTAVTFAALAGFGLAYAQDNPAAARDAAGFKPPIEGHARVYILRPGFSRELRADSPTLAVDGQEVARLKFESYTNLDLKPGSVEISLQPNPGESPVWKGTWRIAVEAGRSYYLAIWNSTSVAGSASGAGYIPPPPVGSPGAQGLFGLFQILMMVDFSSRNPELQFELVPEAEALPVLSTLAPL